MAISTKNEFLIALGIDVNSESAQLNIETVNKMMEKLGEAFNKEFKLNLATTDFDAVLEQFNKINAVITTTSKNMVDLNKIYVDFASANGDMNTLTYSSDIFEGERIESYSLTSEQSSTLKEESVIIKDLLKDWVKLIAARNTYANQPLSKTEQSLDLNTSSIEETSATLAEYGVTANTVTGEIVSDLNKTGEASVGVSNKIIASNKLIEQSNAKRNDTSWAALLKEEDSESLNLISTYTKLIIKKNELAASDNEFDSKAIETNSARLSEVTDKMTKFGLITDDVTGTITADYKLIEDGNGKTADAIKANNEKIEDSNNKLQKAKDSQSSKEEENKISSLITKYTKLTETQNKLTVARTGYNQAEINNNNLELDKTIDEMSNLGVVVDAETRTIIEDFDTIGGESSKLATQIKASNETIRESNAKASDSETDNTNKERLQDIKDLATEYAEAYEEKKRYESVGTDSATNNSYKQTITQIEELTRQLGEYGIKVNEVDGKLIVSEATKTGITSTSTEMDKLNSSLDKINDDIDSTELKEYLALMKSLYDEKKLYVSLSYAGSDKAALAESEERIQKLKERMNEFSTATKESSQSMAAFTEYERKLNIQTDELENNLNRMGTSFGSVLTRLKTQAENTISYTILYKAFNYVTSFFEDSITKIRDLDTEITNIQMVIGKTDTQVQNLVSSYADLAKELGATTIEVTQGSVEWLRQGKTVEETTTLLTASTMLSKIGMIESAEATELMTATLNGFSKSAEDAISIVDKLSAVDLAYATSAEEIAVALQYTASSADMAGVSLDKMISLITVVSQTTRLSAESIGQSFKTIISRMQNIAAGVFTDDETGEALNDVEAVLGKVGIALRDNETTWRNLEEVLDEVGTKWTTFNDVEQSAIATALAGTRQRDKLVATFNNYDEVLKATEVSLNSAGTAEVKYADYLDSIDAKVNQLTATWEDFVNNLDGSDYYGAAVEGVTSLISGFDTAVNTAGLFNMTLLDVVGGLSVLAVTAAGVVKAWEFTNTLQKSSEALTHFSKKVAATDFSSITTKTELSTEQLTSFKSALKNASSETAISIISSQELTEAQQRQLLSTVGITGAEQNEAIATAQMSLARRGAVIPTEVLSKATLTLSAAIKTLTVGISVGMTVYAVYSQALSMVQDRQEELIETSAELSDALDTAKQTYTDGKQSVEDLTEEYNSLADGVDKFGNNISLSTSEYTRYEEIVQSLLDLSPQLTASYVSENGLIEDKNLLLQETVDLLKQEYDYEVAKAARTSTTSDVLAGSLEEYRDLLSDNGINDLFGGSAFGQSIDGNFVATDFYFDIIDQIKELNSLEINDQDFFKAINDVLTKGEASIEDYSFETQAEINWNTYFRDNANAILNNGEELFVALNQFSKDNDLGSDFEKANDMLLDYIKEARDFETALDSLETTAIYEALLPTAQDALNGEDILLSWEELSVANQTGIEKFIETFDFSDISTNGKIDTSKLQDVQEEVREFTTFLSQEIGSTTISTTGLSIGSFVDSINSELSDVEDEDFKANIKIAVGLTESVEQQIESVRKVIGDAVYDLSYVDLTTVYANLEEFELPDTFNQLEIPNTFLETANQKLITDVRDTVDDILDEYKNLTIDDTLSLDYDIDVTSIRDTLSKLFSEEELNNLTDGQVIYLHTELTESDIEKVKNGFSSIAEYFQSQVSEMSNEDVGSLISDYGSQIILIRDEMKEILGDDINSMSDAEVIYAYTQIKGENIDDFVSDTIDEINKKIENEAIRYSYDIEITNDSISNISSGISMAVDAFEEQAETGTLAADTILELISAGYASAIMYDEVTGAATLSTGATYDLVDSMIAEEKAALLIQESAIIEHLDGEKKSVDELAASYGTLAQFMLEKYTSDQIVAGFTDPAAEANLEAVRAQKAALEELQGSIGGWSSGVYSSSDSSSSDSTDEWAEEFETLYDDLQYQRDMDLIDAKTYYLTLDSLNKKYFANSEEYLDEYKDYNSEVYQGLLELQSDAIDKKIEKLEAEKEALEDVNEEEELALALQEAQDRYDAATSQLVNRVYTNEEGWTWSVDADEVADAEEELAEAEYNIEIKAIEDQIEKLEELQEKLSSYNDDLSSHFGDIGYTMDENGNIIINGSEEVAAGYEVMSVSAQDYSTVAATTASNVTSSMAQINTAIQSINSLDTSGLSSDFTSYVNDVTLAFNELTTVINQYILSIENASMPSMDGYDTMATNLAEYKNMVLELTTASESLIEVYNAVSTLDYNNIQFSLTDMNSILETTLAKFQELSKIILQGVEDVDDFGNAGKDNFSLLEVSATNYLDTMYLVEEGMLEVLARIQEALEAATLAAEAAEEAAARAVAAAEKAAAAAAATSSSSSSDYVEGRAGGIEMGAVDWTGLTMLHGTPSNPEYVLTANQMENFVKNMSRNIPAGQLVSNTETTETDNSSSVVLQNCTFPLTNVTDATNFSSSLKQVVNQNKK